MTSVLLAVTFFLGGAMLVASRRPWVRVVGAVSGLIGAGLWLGLSVLCGDGPLMHCAAVQ
jgi:hypothetical protein